MIKSFNQIISDALVGKRIKIWRVTSDSPSNQPFISIEPWKSTQTIMFENEAFAAEIIQVGKFFRSKGWIEIQLVVENNKEMVLFHFQKDYITFLTK